MCHSSQVIVLAPAAGWKYATSSVRPSAMSSACSMSRVNESRSSSRAAAMSVSAMAPTLLRPITCLDIHMNVWSYNCVDAFAVIADPTRRRILDTLRDADRDVGELVAQLDISQSLASKHLAVLRNAGT